MRARSGHHAERRQCNDALAVFVQMAELLAQGAFRGLRVQAAKLLLRGDHCAVSASSPWRR
ncbi:hypothetical protein SDC9_100122 [bioreactor metagenome]|uniref:Uncharacterized protein n=1 Tax=bioreactor metagenome TaxID=1076179 RepID=A0A645AJF5_9ZZZZ